MGPRRRSSSRPRATRLPDLIARVKELHSYECPCIEALEVTDGNPEFLAWVARETGAG